MTYRICPGVVLVSVCDEYLLVATHEAHGKVPYAKGVNNTGAYFWSLLEQKMDIEQIVKTAAKAYKVNEEQVRPLLLRFMNTLKDTGYLLVDGD